MKEFFKKIENNSLVTCFPDEESCLKFLAEQKWKDGYLCKKCGNANYCKGKTAFARRCTRCKHEESAASHTVFHNCRIPLQKAFQIAFMVCDNPEISTYKISDKVELRQMTCWKFKKKISACLEKDLNLTDHKKLEGLIKPAEATP